MWTSTVGVPVKNYIAGGWSSGSTDQVIDVLNPSNGDVVTHFFSASPFDVDRAVGAAQAAAPWLPPTPESSLTATAQLAAGALRLGLDHPWLAGASGYCWERVGQVSPTDAYAFLFVVDFLDATPERDRADRALEALKAQVPADGRIAVGVGTEGETLEPLVVASRPEHAGTRLFAPAVLAEALDSLEAGQGDDGGWDFDWAKWNPAAAWEWRGAVTVNALSTLRAYGRL